MTRLAKWTLVIAMIAVGADGALAQSYPTKPIRVLTGAAGAGVDLALRIIIQGITGSLGQPLIVDNRGTGFIAPETVSKSPPDGYTILFFTGSTWITPLLQKTPYDPIKDLAPITLADSSPNLLIVHPSVPVKTVKELIALAKAKPGQLNYGSGLTGSGSYLAGELFNSLAHVNIVTISYKNGPIQLADLVSGQVQITFTTPSSIMEQLKAGKVRALAVTSAKPSPLAPGLPTVASAGVPGYEVEQIHAAFAPAATPRPIINRINEEIVRFLKTAEGRDKLFSLGIEAVGTTPEELGDYVKRDMARLSKVIKDAGIKVE